MSEEKRQAVRIASIDRPERWRPVPLPDYAEAYEVSDRGHLRRVKDYIGKGGALRRKAPYPLNPWLWNRKTGHRKVQLSWNGKSKSFYAHRLVALAFLPNPDNYPVVRHVVAPLEGGSNAVDNLVWGTQQMNVQDRQRLGNQTRGGHHPKAKLTEQQVREIRRRYASEDVSMAALAKEYGVTNQNIDALLKRRSWKHVM